MTKTYAGFDITNSGAKLASQIMLTDLLCGGNLGEYDASNKDRIDKAYEKILNAPEDKMLASPAWTWERKHD